MTQSRRLRRTPLRITQALALLSVALTPVPVPAAVRPSADTPAAVQASRIPDVHGTTLAGQPVDLPAQLHGRTGILVLGFSRDARNPVRDWGRRLAADYAASSTISYFEMPVLASVPRLLRGLVLRQIAADVSDGGKPHLLPITTDESRWRALVRYNQPNDAYLLIVNGDGTVRATLSGPFSDAAYATLQQDLAAAAPSRN